MESLRLALILGLVAAVGAPPSAAMIDRDSDGLSDVWAALYHLQAGALAKADEDGDGLSNAEEAQAGTDPLSAASRFAAATQLDAAGNVLLRWRGGGASATP